MKINFRRIHIIGSVASGKTTLAKQLSSKLLIPYYELDNIMWIRTNAGDKRRTLEERTECLKGIVQQDTWIVEGVHHQWINESLLQAELILL